MPYAEMMFISAVDRTASEQDCFEMIDMVLRKPDSSRIATGVLNEIMTEAVAMQQPPSDKGKRLKLYLYYPGSGKAADLRDFRK